MARASTFIKIPKDRIGALVGVEGRVKAIIEKKLNVNLNINSETGDVTMSFVSEMHDPSIVFRAQEVVAAIGRGFSSDRAFRLLYEEDAAFEVIDLQEIFGKSISDLRRVKGRIIGQEGKTRRIIEDLTEADISVHGHTVSIIASIEEMEVAREAVHMLMRGKQHSTVYRFLHRKRRELNKKKLELWEKPVDKKER